MHNVESSKEKRPLMVKRPELLVPFGEGFLKARQRRGLQGTWSACAYSSDGWWWGNWVVFWESQSSIFQFQVVWDLHPGGWHAINFFHLQTAQGYGSGFYHNPCRGTNVPWLCFMAIIILSCLIVFLCFWIFLFLWLNLLLGTQERPRKMKLFYEQEEGTQGGLSYSVSVSVPTLLFSQCCCEMNYAGSIQQPICSFFCKKSHTRGIFWAFCFLSPNILIPKGYKCASPGQLVLLPQPLQELSRRNLKLAPVLGEGDQEKAVGVCISHSAMSDSLQLRRLGSSVHGILHARILEWVLIPFSGEIFPTQGSNPDILHCRQIVY